MAHRDGTGWLTMQSAANQSPAPNSLLTGNLTGNFAESGPPLRFRRLVSERIQWLPAEFPTQQNREFANAYLEAPKLGRTERLPKKRIRFLSRDQEARLLDSYAPHVRPIAETLCFQGLRIGEALRLDWAQVDWSGNSLFVAETKTGEPRAVTIHPRVRKALHRVWVGRGSPAEGRVFLNRVGRPYADPRGYKLPGGSPIRRAHQTACARAGIDDFHVHDWRHHWACRCVMSGIDLETIRQEGGWKSLRMVERYGTVSAEHRASAMTKLQ